MKIYSTDEKTIGTIIADKSSSNGNSTFLTYYGQNYSYQFLDEHTNRIANGFIQLGIKKGDHISVLLSNCPEFLWTIFAIGKIGAVAVPINTAAKGDLLYYYIDHSDSSWIVISQEFMEKLHDVSHRLTKIKGCLCLTGDERDIQPELANYVKEHEMQVVNYNVLEKQSAERPNIDVKPNDPYLLMYTSGTTGPSKGVVSPHSQGINVGLQVGKVYGYGKDDVIYTCLPLFHGNALWYSTMPALLCDSTLALSKRFSASRFWDEIKSTGATQFNSLGAMTNIIVKNMDKMEGEAHSLRQCMVVPSLNKEMSEYLQNELGIKVTSLYAMTETFAVTLFGPNSPQEKFGSAGKPLDYVDVKIIDEHDNILPPGQVGEIVIRPNEPGIMMTGYYKMPEATLQAMTNLWFHTGDRGYVDKDGYLYFVDRKKDAIRRRGENISAYEIELILAKHESVYEAAAIPVPSQLSEDEVMVFVVLNDGMPMSHEDVIRYCDENMSYFMVPRYVHFIDQLPKTPSEKIEKYKLMKWANENLDFLWDREKKGIKLKR